MEGGAGLEELRSCLIHVCEAQCFCAEQRRRKFSLKAQGIFLGRLGKRDGSGVL